MRYSEEDLWNAVDDVSANKRMFREAEEQLLPFTIVHIKGIVLM